MNKTTTASTPAGTRLFTLLLTGILLFLPGTFAAEAATPTHGSVALSADAGSTVSSVKGSQKNLYLVKGKSCKVPAVAYNEKDMPVKASIRWRSSKTKVATVSSGGRIVGVNHGTAKITASAGGKKWVYTVTVVEAPTRLKGIKIRNMPKTMARGKTQKLNVVCTPAKATGVQPHFRSSNKEVVTVDKAGTLTAVGKGKADVTVKAGGKSKRYTVTVESLLQVYDSATGQVVSGDEDEIIASVVMAEMGESDTEAMKAEAVAVHSLLQYQYASGVAAPSVNMRTPSTAVRNAVAAVSGQILSYGEQPIMAVWTQSTAGHTNDAANFYGESSAYPYLKRVEDPHGISHTGQTCSLNAEQMAQAIEQMIGRKPTGDASTWVSLRGVGGYISSATVSGVKVTPEVFCSKLPGLQSAYITGFTYNATDRSWTVKTSGSGSGVGMSLAGASGYAKCGWTYDRILSHYYSGASLAA